MFRFSYLLWFCFLEFGVADNDLFGFSKDQIGKAAQFINVTAQNIKSGVAENDFFGCTKEQIVEAATHFRFINISAQNIKFLVYQKGSNTPVPINIQNASSVLNPDAPYKFIVHGWGDNGNLPWFKSMAAAFHKVGIFNIIAIDWSKDASNNYIYASSATKSVGDHVGEFILGLKINFDKVHLIGHSLGAQVCGFIGQKIGEGKVDRISGLDPAGPLFEFPIPFIKSWRLTEEDAKFVDVMHTQILWRGVVGPCGTVDFFVNEGGPQPDCLKNNTVSCSHQMAHTYFTLTIKNANKYEGVKPSNCLLPFCANDTAYMGYWVRRSATKSYSVTASATGIDPYSEF